MNNIKFQWFPCTLEGIKLCEKQYADFRKYAVKVINNTEMDEGFGTINCYSSNGGLFLLYMIKRRKFMIKDIYGTSICFCNNYIFNKNFEQIKNKVEEHKCIKIDAKFNKNCVDFSLKIRINWINNKIGHGEIPFVNEEVFNTLVMKFVLISHQEVFEEY